MLIYINRRRVRGATEPNDEIYEDGERSRGMTELARR